MAAKPSRPLTKADLTEAIGQVLEVVKDTRLQLERKIDWARQDAKEQLESTVRQLTGRMDTVQTELKAEIHTVRTELKTDITSRKLRCSS